MCGENNLKKMIEHAVIIIWKYYTPQREFYTNQELFENS